MAIPSGMFCTTIASTRLAPVSCETTYPVPMGQTFR